jgi:L-alanine-DL-glutamate epimerase-like enolase superfamily enzyme
MRKRLVRNPIRLEDGYAVVPTEPGLGVDVDLDAVSEFVVG